MYCLKSLDKKLTALMQFSHAPLICLQSLVQIIFEKGKCILLDFNYRPMPTLLKFR